MGDQKIKIILVKLLKFLGIKPLHLVIFKFNLVMILELFCYLHFLVIGH